MNKRIIIAIVTVSVCLTACIKQKSATDLAHEIEARKAELAQEQETEKLRLAEETHRQKLARRVSVTKISEFTDDLAYSGTRGVYIVKDNQTGQEFIGVSGVGISEVGRHSTGKITNSDER